MNKSLLFRAASLSLALIAAPTALLIAGPAAAQLGQSQGYKFLQAVKDSKNDEVIAFLDKPGAITDRGLTVIVGAVAWPDTRKLAANRPPY